MYRYSEIKILHISKKNFMVWFGILNAFRRSTKITPVCIHHPLQSLNNTVYPKTKTQDKGLLVLPKTQNSGPNLWMRPGTLKM